MKKIFKIFFWLIVGLIIALILLPILFKDEVQTSIKEQINENVNATVDFEDVSLSIFKNFPSLSIDLENVLISGIDQFQDVTLIKADNIYLGTDLKSIIKPGEGINIKSIKLSEPVINLIVDKNGIANYDITKESQTTSESSSYMGEIESYEIDNGSVSYRDDQANLVFAMRGIDHQGKGSFKDVAFDLATKTEVKEIDFKNAGLTYLNKGKLTAAVDLAVDLDAQKYSFKNNQIRYNDLDVSFLGDILMKDSGIDFNINFEAPNNKVSSLLSLIPSGMAGDYTNIKSEGSSFFKGQVKGLFNSDKNLFPNIDITANIENGSVQYPDLKLPINDISFDTRILSKASNWNDLSIDVKKFGFKINEDRVIGRMKIDQAMLNPSVEGMVDGTVDLVNLTDAFPVQNMDIRDGKIKANFTIDATAEAIEKQDYSNIAFTGDITSSDIDMQYEQWPVKVKSTSSKISPSSITTQFETATIGQSDFVGDLAIKNPLAFLSEAKEANTVINIRSNKLDLDELQKLSSESSETQTSDTLTQDITMLKELKLAGNYTAEEVKYENYDIDKFSFSGQLENDKLKLTKTTMRLDNSPVEMRGEINNPISYVFNDEKLNGKIFLDAAKINANKYLNETGETTEIVEPFIVPNNIELDFYPEIKSLIYDKYDLTDIQGKISIKDGMAMLSDGVAKAMGGQINLDGLYDSTDSEEPTFDLRYNMEGIDFAKIFKYSDSFSKLAPIAEYIEGLFNSTLVIGGPLTKDMMPDFTKLTASGFLETMRGQVKGFGPLAKLGDAIGIDKLKDFDIKGTKNWFDVKEGRVILKPHEYNIDDMLFVFGGNHGIDQSLDYTIKAQIPRDKLKKDKLGKNLEYGMSFLEKEASSRGVNIDLGEMIYLDIFMTGTLLKPKFKVVPVGSGGKTLTDVVKNEIQNQKQILKDTLTKELEKRTDKAKDSISKVITAKTDTIKSQAKKKIDEQVEKKKSEIKDILKEKIDTVVTSKVSDSIQSALENKAKEILGDKNNAEVDELKDKIKDWNPFKKKGG